MVEKINHIIKGAHAFALYRLPFSDECHIVAQTSAPTQTLHTPAELEGLSGFVMTPFHTSGSHPTVLIKPEMEKTLRMEIPCADNGETERKGDIGRIDSVDNEKRAYRQVFGRFHTALCAGEFEKLVLSRRTRLQVGDIAPVSVFLRACAAYPRMMVYLCSAPECGTWLGCTPEILLAGSKSHYRTVALAGTMAVDPAVDTTQHPICWSEKNRHEQQIVADFIREQLRPFAHVIEEEGPYTSRAGRLLHLKTEFHFSAAWPRTGGQEKEQEKEQMPATETSQSLDVSMPQHPDTSMLQRFDTPHHPLTAPIAPQQRMSSLIEHLHPTPAVCGLPQEKALKFIVENEGYDRSYYSGIVGMLNAKDDTNLYVNLRCCSLSGDGTATFYAGGGILPSSDVESEWQETEEKLKTILHVFR